MTNSKRLISIALPLVREHVETYLPISTATAEGDDVLFDAHDSALLNVVIKGTMDEKLK